METQVYNFLSTHLGFSTVFLFVEGLLAATSHGMGLYTMPLEGAQAAFPPLALAILGGAAAWGVADFKNWGKWAAGVFLFACASRSFFYVFGEGYSGAVSLGHSGYLVWFAAGLLLWGIYVFKTRDE